MGTYSADDFDSGTRAALAGGTTMVVDFVLPRPGQSLLDALKMWDNKTARAHCDYSFHMAVTWWSEQVFDEMSRGRRARHQHLQALHGLQGRADGERRRDVSRRSSAAPSSGRCRSSMPRTATSSRELQAEAAGRGQHRAGGACLFAPAGGRGRGDQPRDHDRRHGRRAALCRACLLRAGARGDPPGPAAGQARLRRAADPAPDARRERVFQPGLGLCGAAGDVAAVPRQAPPGLPLGRAGESGSLQVVATDHCAFTTEQKRFGVGDFTKIPNGTGGLEDRLPMLWT